jgi:hypothetical protein
MDASFAGIWFAAGLGAFWALVLGAVLALCRAAQGARPRHAPRSGLGR